MAYWFLMMAALVSLAGAVLHGVVGGRLYMRNINNSNMEALTKSLSLVAWHIFTIFLVVGAGAFVYVAYVPSAALAAYPLIMINLLGAIMFVLLGLGAHRHLLRMPGAYLMGATALFAWLGVG